MLHWIKFKNDLPARDVAAIRKVSATLEGGSTNTPRMPAMRMSLHRPQVEFEQEQTLTAGATTCTRYFYKTDADGKRLSSKVYTLHFGGPLQVARDIARSSTTLKRSREVAPRRVLTAVHHAVEDGYVTAAHGRKYCEKYARDASNQKMTVHIRESGKRKVRQYKVAYNMNKHPSKHDIHNMKTKHVTVSYVQTFAC